MYFAVDGLACFRTKKAQVKTTVIYIVFFWNLISHVLKDEKRLRLSEMKGVFFILVEQFMTKANSRDLGIQVLKLRIFRPFESVYRQSIFLRRRNQIFVY